MLRIQNIPLPIDGGQGQLEKKAARILGVKPETITGLSLARLLPICGSLVPGLLVLLSFMCILLCSFRKHKKDWPFFYCTKDGAKRQRCVPGFSVLFCMVSSCLKKTGRPAGN